MSISNFDYFIFQKLNSLAGKNFYFDILIIFLAEYLIYILLILVIFYFFLRFRKKIRKLAESLILVFIIIGASFALRRLIAFFLPRNRPFIDHYKTYRLLKIFETFAPDSFPSGHASLAFALAFFSFFVNKKIGYFNIFLAFIISLARVISGIHYPLDIIGGLVLGFIVAFITNFVYNKIYG